MMEHTSLINKNKKGTSMLELIAYVMLYGIVMSLLATLVFVIVQAARKVNRQAILNRGTTMMYTEILAQTTNLGPDTVDKVVYKNASGNEITDPETNKTSINSISITFIKQYDYAPSDNYVVGDKTYSEGDRYPLTTPLTLEYVYTKGTDYIDVVRNGDYDNKSTINLDYNMTISSVNDESIYGFISVDTQSTTNKYVSFNGCLNFDNRKMEFRFIIPVFISN